MNLFERCRTGIWWTVRGKRLYQKHQAQLIREEQVKVEAALRVLDQTVADLEEEAMRQEWGKDHLKGPEPPTVNC